MTDSRTIIEFVDMTAAEGPHVTQEVRVNGTPVLAQRTAPAAFDVLAAAIRGARKTPDATVSDENTPPASQNGPQDARNADSGTGGPPEPQNGAQGRIGWLRLRRGSTRRFLVREVEGGWTQDGTDLCDWSAESYPDAEFTPIRTLADDEVAVKRDDVAAAIKVAEHLCSGLVPDRSIRRTATSVLQGMAAALGAGR